MNLTRHQSEGTCLKSTPAMRDANVAQKGGGSWVTFLVGSTSGRIQSVVTRSGFSGTSPTVWAEGEVGRRAEDRASAATLSDQINEIGFYLGISRTDLARIMQVSRPTLYAWMKAERTPNDRSIARINELLRVVELLRRDEFRPLLGRFTRELRTKGITLLDLLVQDVIDFDEVAKHLLGIRSAVCALEMDERRQRLLGRSEDRRATDSRVARNIRHQPWK